MKVTFPRDDDGKGHAWGCHGDMPVEIWERFSPAYEAQLQKILSQLDQAGFDAEIGGAGSEDGEYIVAKHPDGRSIFQHLEDPTQARFLANMDDAALQQFIKRANR